MTRIKTHNGSYGYTLNKPPRRFKKRDKSYDTIRRQLISALKELNRAHGVNTDIIETPIGP